MTITFDAAGRNYDFTPVVLRDLTVSHGDGAVALEFSDWDALRRIVPAATDDEEIVSMGGYDLDGYGITGVVIAMRLQAGLPIELGDIDDASDDDECLLYFTDAQDAAKSAQMLQSAVTDYDTLLGAVTVAVREGFGMA